MTDKIIHGFRFTRIRELPELSAELMEAVHEKSGAELLFIKRDDPNKTFAISFKTIPEDSTGVFHILEHSVLCGSKKFPMKEPFVDLLKSSLKTFLNAMTFPDKTMYPISSRSDKDFLNLTDVYMDAVLHPMAIEKPEIFYQEGWHYELHPGDDELNIKGVVYNEMKGAYSSVDDLEFEYISKLLFKGTPYSHDSGGNPEKIPTLTYESFCNAHKRFYHPSNSKIILDGDVKLEPTLELLDSYLREYDRAECDFKIERVTPSGHAELTEKYEISSGESEEGKNRITLGFYTFPYYDRKGFLALSAAIEAIAGTNEAPLRKEVLDTGLCEDIYFSPMIDGIQDNCVFLTIKNVKTENKEAVISKVYEVLNKIVKQGIDKEVLASCINRAEFKLREQDASFQPMGISNAIAAMDLWLYGDDPMLGLAFEDNLAFVKGKLSEEGYFENLIRDVIINSKHSVCLTLVPDNTLGERRAKEEKERLAKILFQMTEEEKQNIISLTERLEAWQKSEDTPEAKATLPKLSRADIPEKPAEIPSAVYNIDGSTLVHTSAKSRGITYLWCSVDVSDLEPTELFYLTMLSELYANVNTDKSEAKDIQTRIKSAMGSFSGSVFISGDVGHPRVYFNISASFLDDKKHLARDIISEVVFSSKFNDKDTISKIIKQVKLAAYEGMVQQGHLVALGRASAYVNKSAMLSEFTEGIEAYKLLCELDREYEKNQSALEERLNGLVCKLKEKSRLTVFMGGARDDAFAKDIISMFSAPGDTVIPYDYEPLGILNEGISVPSQVSYASAVADITEGGRLHGSLAVVRNILSYGYLWNSIRVQGGAYGAGFVQRPHGIIGFYSYRDPSASRTLDIYEASAKKLREIANTEDDLTNYIIGTIGDNDPLVTPKSVSAMAVSCYLRKESYEDRLAYRRELINTSRDDLLRCADLIDKITACGAKCVVGAKSILEACGDKLSAIIEIN